MNHALVVRGFQRIGNLPSDAERFIQWDRSGLDLVSERRSFDYLHHQVVGSDVVKRADVEMIERRGSSSLALETFIEFFGGNLDGYVAPEPRISGAIDLAHPASTEKVDDLVWSKTSTTRQIHQVTLSSRESLL
jgi:hypothetical protein